MEVPEIKIEQLQPIDFSQSDEDRVKDLFEKIFVIEYQITREGWDHQISNGLAKTSAMLAASMYKTWLKEQEKIDE